MVPMNTKVLLSVFVQCRTVWEKQQGLYSIFIHVTAGHIGLLKQKKVFA